MENDRLWEVIYVSDEKFKKFMDNIDTVIFEVQGVVACGNKLITNVDKCLRKLKDLGKKILFTTSSVDESVEEITEMLKEFSVEENDITSPNEIIRSTLMALPSDLTAPNQHILLVGPHIFKEQLENDGHNIIGIEDVKTCPLIKLDYKHMEIIRSTSIECGKLIKAIILCDYMNFDMETAQILLYILKTFSDIVIFISTIRDLKVSNLGMKTIGNKLYIDAIKRWATSACINVAKPSGRMGRKLIEKYNIKDPSRVLCIGYCLDTDVSFGLKAGFKTLLILSGIDQDEEVEDCSHCTRRKDKMPHLIAEDLSEFYDKLCDVYDN